MCVVTYIKEPTLLVVGSLLTYNQEFTFRLWYLSHRPLAFHTLHPANSHLHLTWNKVLGKANQYRSQFGVVMMFFFLFFSNSPERPKSVCSQGDCVRWQPRAKGMGSNPLHPCLQTTLPRPGKVAPSVSTWAAYRTPLTWMDISHATHVEALTCTWLTG